MTDQFSGGCLCGDVRYEVTGPKGPLVLCHCRDCQYVSGGEPAAIVVTRRDSFHLVAGESAVFRSQGDSGGDVARHFCSRCGTPLFSEVSGSPKLVFVKAGSLDQPGDLSVSMAVYAGSAQPWAHYAEGVPQFPKGAG